MIVDTMTLLWVQHVAWTRKVIVSTLAKLPDASTAIARLMRNQDDIGAALGKFYGPEFGRQSADLLRQHIEISLGLVKAAASGNVPEVQRQNALWHENSIRIARALSSVNPYWSEAALRAMLFNHLALTQQEATARIAKNWSGDVAAFDAVVSQALMMAKALADGISKQFPGA